jgi:tetratricopeptide (TPR) repeat protein
MDSNESSTVVARSHELRERVPSFLTAWLLLVSGLLIFSPLLEGGTTHMAVMIIRLMVLALFGLYLAAAGRSGTIVLPPAGLSGAVLAFLGLAVISVTHSPYIHQSVQWLAVLCTYAALLYLLVSFTVEWDHIATLAAVLAGMGIFEAGWALWQGWGGGAARPVGTFFNPNFLAGYIALAWAVVLGYLCHVRIGRRGWPGMRRYSLADLVLPILLLGLLLLVVVRTGSRGGLLCIAAGSAVIISLRFGRWGFGLFALALVCSVLLVPNPLRERVLAEHAVNPVGYARWEMWRQSIRQMIDHPWGVGLGLYQYFYPRYAFPVEGQIARYGMAAQTPHSEYVQMGVEIGIASIPVFCWGIVQAVRESAALLNRRLRRWQRSLAVGLSATAAAALAHAAVDSNLHEPALAIGLTLCVGLILAARRMSGPCSEPARVMSLGSRRSRLLWTGGGLCVAAGLAFMAVKVGVAWLAYDMGSEALAHRDYDRAAAEYRHAISLDPGKALYHSVLAAAQFQSFEATGDVAVAMAAASELEEALALNPLDGRLCGLLGHVYARLASRASLPAGSVADEQRGTWRRTALAAYERAIRLEPFNPFHRLAAAQLYLALGDAGRAEASVQEAVGHEPNFLSGREWLARRYLQTARLDEARREHREIVERQQRYVGWNKTAYEAQMLRADATGLAAALEAGRPKS